MSRIYLVLLTFCFIMKLQCGIHPQFARLILEEHKYKPIEGTAIMIGRQQVYLTPGEAINLVKQLGIPIRNDYFVEYFPGSSSLTDRSFFSIFSNARVLALDVSPYEGAEIIADLNQPLNSEYSQMADFVFNGSCLDNLWDPASAMKNISKMLKPQGRVIHAEHGSPLHSAYIMYSPGYFFDYFALNEFDDCKVYTCLFNTFYSPWHLFLWDSYEGNKITPYMHRDWNHIFTIVIAEKGQNSTTDQVPIQGGYRAYHGTDADVYMKSYLKFQKSKRTVPQLQKPITPSYQAGFTYLGLLPDAVY